MRKKIIVPIIALIGLGSLGVMGSSGSLVETLLESVKNIPIAKGFLSEVRDESEINQMKIQETGETLSTEIPEYILYDRMFSLILKFKKMAEEQAARDEAATAFHGYFAREASLDDLQAGILQETAADYVEAAGLVDSQAETIIEQLRMQNPVAVSEGQFIQPSPELLQLQEQRNKLALHYRDQLQSLLGSDKFNELDNFVMGRFASGFQSLPLSSVQESKNAGGNQ